MKIVTLTKKSDFLRLRASGRKYQIPYINIVYCKNVELNHLRLAFALSTKIANSVVRNRIRRRIKEAVQACIKAHGNFRYDILFIPKKSTADVLYSDLLEEINKFFKFLEYQQ